MVKAFVVASLGVLSLVLDTGCGSVPGGPASSGGTLEESIVFQPQAYPVGNWFPVPAAEDVWFDSPDGVRLHGWFAEAKRPRAVVLYLHGNAGNVTNRRDVLRLFPDQLS